VNGLGLLVLDFDGVVCDALLECAAVSAVGGQPDGPLPSLDEALGMLTHDYVTAFASIRPYCRTLDDFMVTNVITQPVTSRVDFDAAREACDEAQVRRQACRAQRARDLWRGADPQRWLELHTPYSGVRRLVRAADGRVVIVSAKDAASVWALLQHFGLAEDVHDVVGDCTDKASAVDRLVATSGPALFLDDNLANVLAVDALTDVRSVWATWGYHSAEDVVLAATRHVTSLSLDELGAVA
jgi:phosphoglycolate phosphatase-like HAD superfamily hydrolase